MTSEPPLKKVNNEATPLPFYFDIYFAEPKQSFAEAIILPILKKDASKFLQWSNSRINISTVFPCIKRFKTVKDHLHFVLSPNTIEAVNLLSCNSLNNNDDSSKTFPCIFSFSDVQSFFSSPRVLPLPPPFYTLSLTTTPHHSPSQHELLKKVWPITLKTPPLHPDMILPAFVLDDEQAKVSKIMLTLVDQSNSSGFAYGALVDPFNNYQIITSSFESNFHPLGHVSLVLLEKFAKNFRTPANYFLSNFDIFLTHEPCPFCTMALIHSRIRRCWFAKIHCNGGISVFNIPYIGFSHYMYNCGDIHGNLVGNDVKCRCTEI
ncbi:hypothetical protein RCL1_001744 [Eukaryota sp. TZLM3-RCL]